MCKLISLELGGRTIKVASIKRDYISNIANNASKCNLIDKVVLFGSALEERCTEDSDIDIAVFGRQSKTKAFQSKDYKNYINSIVSYGGIQDYDILYFDSTKEQSSIILDDINRGEILFER